MQKNKKPPKKYYWIISWSLLLMNIVPKRPFPYKGLLRFHPHKCTRTESGYPSPRSPRHQVGLPVENVSSPARAFADRINRSGQTRVGCPDWWLGTRSPVDWRVGPTMATWMAWRNTWRLSGLWTALESVVPIPGSQWVPNGVSPRSTSRVEVKLQMVS